jgi:hypothetical protein
MPEQHYYKIIKGCLDALRSDSFVGTEWRAGNTIVLILVLAVDTEEIIKIFCVNQELSMSKRGEMWENIAEMTCIT